MKNSQKGFIFPLVAVIVAMVIGGGAYVYIKNMEVSQTSIAGNTQDTNFKFISPTQATSTIMQGSVGVGRGDAVFHITESPDDGYDSQFTDSFHIDLFSNNLLVYSVDSQQEGFGSSFVSIKDIPFGEYTIDLKVVGYKKFISTFIFDNKAEGFPSIYNDGYGGVNILLTDSDRVGR